MKKKIILLLSFVIILLMEMWIRDRRILIAQQPHILKEGVRAVHISRHGLRPSAGEGAGEGWLPWPGPLCAPPQLCIRDRHRTGRPGAV